MSAHALVSVIVAAHNHERFVVEALMSLMAQTHQHLELVVLDDGSTDATYAKIRELKSELEQRFARVVIGTKDNEGSGRTIARCLQLARSDLVYMLDSDDVAHPDAIACLLPLVTPPDVALAVGDNEYIDAASSAASLERDGRRHVTLLSYYTKSRTDFVMERDFGTYRSLIQGNYVPNGWLLRRSCVLDAGGYGADLILDDWPLLLRLARKYRLRCAGSVLAKYRLHDKNTAVTQGDRLLLDTARILLQERAYCRGHGCDREWWTHAHRVFEKLTTEEITRIVDNPTADENWWQDRFGRIEDLARLGRHETDLLQVKWDLDQAVTNRDRLQRQHEELSRLLCQLDAERSDLASRLELSDERIRLAELGRQRLRAELSTQEIRLTALQASRTWRWSKPLRSVLALLSGLRRRSWEANLEPATPHPTRLGALEVPGWVFHRDSPVQRVEILMHEDLSVPVEYGIDRPDVAEAFPDDDVGRPGFKAIVHALEDPVNLRIKMVCADGRIQLTRRRLARSPAVNARAREIYGAPTQSRISLLEWIRCWRRYGAIGAYIWESGRIRGWVRGEGEAEALARASDSLPGAPVIVEIGAFLGCSTVLLAGPRKQRRSGRVHCVDSFSASGDDAAVPIYRAIAGAVGMPLREAFERNMRRAGLLDWITVHEMTSHEAARQWSTPIDLLYLDGDVSSAGALEIFRDWSPFLRRGGILAINGTAERASRRGACSVVQEFVRLPDYDEVSRVDHITFARKS